MSGIILEPQQSQAVYKAEIFYNKWKQDRKKQVFEISGCPGSGKTTILKYIIENLGFSKKEVLYMSFMGKVVSRMMECGLNAKTIDSAIYDYRYVISLDDKGNPIYKSGGGVKKELKRFLKEHLDPNIKMIVLDEAPTIETNRALDLLSFGIPIICVGDRNQLPPPFGNPYFLQFPDVELLKPMRQALDSYIVVACQKILRGERLQYGDYGDVKIIKKEQVREKTLFDRDMVITCTNNLRREIISKFREGINSRYKDYPLPTVGEKLVCKKNNWSKAIEVGDVEFFMTNGMLGKLEYLDRCSFNGKTLNIDFKADFLKKPYKNINILYEPLFSNVNDDSDENSNFFKDRFEFGYATTAYSNQGSEYNDIMYIKEHGSFNKDKLDKMDYTSISRAKKNVIMVM